MRPWTTVSRYPPSSVARTAFPAAIASTGVIPKSSSTAVVTNPRHRPYSSARRSSGTSPTIVTFGGGRSEDAYPLARSPSVYPPTTMSFSPGSRRKISIWRSTRFSGYKRFTESHVSPSSRNRKREVATGG